MARTALTLQNVFVDPSASEGLDFAEGGGDGSGNGVTFAHSKTKPAVLIVKNGTGDPVTITVKSNGAMKDGVIYPDLVYTVADGATRPILVPPDEYATSGIVAVDTSESTACGFAAVVFGKTATKYSLPYESDVPA